MVEKSKLISSLGNANSRPRYAYIHTCLGQVLGTDHNTIIDIGGDKNRMNKLTHYHRRSSGVIGDKGGLDDKGVAKIEQR